MSYLRLYIDINYFVGGIFIVTSIDVSNIYNKRHDHVTRDIEILIKKNPEAKNHFVLSTYTNTRNKTYKCYLIDDDGFCIIANKYKYNTRSARLEYKIRNEIIDMLDYLNIRYINQYTILKYKVDMYLIDYNVVIEIDENEHKYKTEYDSKREKEIYDVIKCKFIRIKEEMGIGLAIAMIIKEIYEIAA